MDPITTSLVSFCIVVLAEIGDKSQLVCMMLASRYRGRSVFLGAALAFCLLNLLAVTLGASLAVVLPKPLIAAAAAVLFAIFGFKSLLAGSGEQSEETIVERSGHSIFITTFLMIFVAELGDKTQLAVAAMSVTAPPMAVWLGASVALVLTSALGVYVGKRFLSLVNPIWLHRFSGLLFLVLATISAARLFI